MALTKAQARTLIRAQIPDAARQGWGDGVLDLMIQSVVDELLSEVLDEAPFFYSTLETISTIGSPGFIDLSSAGPLTKRFYRVQSLVRDGQEYSPASSHDSTVFNNAEVTTVAQFTYFIRGSQLWMFPLATTPSIELRYSFLPTAYTSVAETATYGIPDGFDNVVINEILARLNSDVNAVGKYHAISMAALDRLKSRVRREYVGPMVMQAANDILEWGGV